MLLRKAVLLKKEYKALRSMLDDSYNGDRFIKSAIDKSVTRLNDIIAIKRPSLKCRDKMVLSGKSDKKFESIGLKKILSKETEKWRKNISIQNFNNIPEVNKKEVFDCFFRYDTYGSLYNDDILFLSRGVDDPQKSVDATSEAQRAKLNEWYGSTLYSRLNDKATGKIIVVMQRLHQDDLTGHLLELGEQFKVIKLPVIATVDESWVVKNRISGKTRVITRAKGELLHPDRENMDVVMGIKNSMGENAFAAQYQQDPCPPEGGIIKESWLKYYTMAQGEAIDPIKYCRIFLSWDTANKTGPQNAYSACCVVLVTRESNRYKYYLLDVVRGKWEMPDLIKQVQMLYNKWKYEKGGLQFVRLLIEDKASGTQLIQMLNAQRDHHGYKFVIESIKPDTDKVSRLMGVSAYIENGTLRFLQEAAWWPDFKKELLGFPNSKYKDQVDALTQCINYAVQQS